MNQSRPQSIHQFLDLHTRFRSDESMQAVENLHALPSDVFISTFAKSGTTWMQQIVHQLRCKIDDTFDDIYQVVPWIESAIDMNIDPSAPQRGDFRVFKSHLSYRKLPKTGRYIIIVRDPAVVIGSWYQFFEGWLFETGSVSLDDFARKFYFSKFPDHMAHFEEWYSRTNQDDSLVLCYEDLVASPDNVPQLVAEFLDIDLSQEMERAVVKRCSRNYMFQHRNKFAELYMREHLDKALGLPPGGESLKVNRTATNMILSESVLDELAEHWSNNIQRRLGFLNYQQYRAALPNPLNANRKPVSTTEVDSVV